MAVYRRIREILFCYHIKISLSVHPRDKVLISAEHNNKAIWLLRRTPFGTYYHWRSNHYERHFYKKSELSDVVLKEMTSVTPIPEEIDRKLLIPLYSAIG
jgi:hypothetical protein